MITIEKYDYDLPNQVGFVARDHAAQPVAVAKTFSGLLTKLILLDPGFAWGARAAGRATDAELRAATQVHPG